MEQDSGGLVEEWKMVQAPVVGLIHSYESYAFALTQYLLYQLGLHWFYLEREKKHC
jgi:hypothetical protein